MALMEIRISPADAAKGVKFIDWIMADGDPDERYTLDNGKPSSTRRELRAKFGYRR